MIEHPTFIDPNERISTCFVRLHDAGWRLFGVQCCFRALISLGFKHSFDLHKQDCLECLADVWGMMDHCQDNLIDENNEWELADVATLFTRKAWDGDKGYALADLALLIHDMLRIIVNDLHKLSYTPIEEKRQKLIEEIEGDQHTLLHSAYLAASSLLPGLVGEPDVK